MHIELEETLIVDNVEHLNAPRALYGEARRNQLLQLLRDVDIENRARAYPCDYVQDKKPPDTLRHRLGQWLIKAGRRLRDG